MNHSKMHPFDPSTSGLVDHDALADAALELASLAGTVANVCDHAEHNESTDLFEVQDAGRRLASVGVRLADAAAVHPVELYRDRLQAIERRNVLHHENAFDGARAAVPDSTWRELQLVQATHDREYHPDVVGLAKFDQLRHYALHLAKLAGAAADAVAQRVEVDDFIQRRVADMILFSLKLATVTGQRLPESPVVGGPGSDFRTEPGAPHDR